MKTKAHLTALIMKKCVELKVEKKIDAFCNFQAHCNLLEIEVYKNWDVDSKNTLYRASIHIDGSWNTDDHASNFEQVIEDLSAIYLGLGIE
ncbi:hypothetical protein MN869_15455 [Acinetobacter sp. NIPH1876]|uniref:hypothetical protein n=1 Tax=unclassified Acinetobacter TaxID=196816 RepID=UPI00149027A4|nr:MULTISPECIES: hypothetical protein [unclassified Acinetobacter]MCJ0829841.1 hypothetical protein [Acinetobacter sp. NIPH1876]NNP70961.1 hypothetical protein [Acinetobacter sp. Ac_5812]